MGKRSPKFKSSKDGNGSGVGSSLVDGGPASEKATPYKGKFLLHEARPEDANKKCIVIDLDETLVHSSFKVRPTKSDYGGDPNTVTIEILALLLAELFELPTSITLLTICYR